jgi:integrase/recombinase XerD
LHPEAQQLGPRDRAVLLLARVSLRAGDVVALQLTDINGQAATLQVASKNRRQNRLPLPEEVSDAILHYLAHRPVVDRAYVFMTTIAPWKHLSSQIVGQIATWTIHRAGVEAPIHDTHRTAYQPVFASTLRKI